MPSVRNLKPYTLWLVLFVLCVLLFWKIDTRGINEWDEARNGVNAVEMYKNGDWINLYYAGELDTWNAKPPLLIWLVVACYKVFGFNSFALRLPSVLATIGTFIYAWKLLSCDKNKQAALITCLVLLSCKAIVGGHVGLTGDFDAPLVFFLTASAYYFYRFIEFNDSPSIYMVAIFTGLAFYTKGSPSIVYLPSFLLFGALRRGNLTG